MPKAPPALPQRRAVVPAWVTAGWLCASIVNAQQAVPPTTTAAAPVAKHAFEDALATTEFPLPSRDAHGQVTYDFVADAVREVAGADVALVDLERVHGSLARGNISATSLRQVLPWDAQLTRYDLTGKQLRALLAQPSTSPTTVLRSGISENKADQAEYRIAGHPLKAAAHYSVVLLDAGAVRVAGTPRKLPITLHQSLDRYLRAHPFLRATADGRVIADDLPASVQCRDQLQPYSTR